MRQIKEKTTMAYGTLKCTTLTPKLSRRWKGTRRNLIRNTWRRGSNTKSTSGINCSNSKSTSGINCRLVAAGYFSVSYCNVMHAVKHVATPLRLFMLRISFNILSSSFKVFDKINHEHIKQNIFLLQISSFMVLTQRVTRRHENDVSSEQNLHFRMKYHVLAVVQTWITCNLTQDCSSFHRNINLLPEYLTTFCLQWYRNSPCVSCESQAQDASVRRLIQCCVILQFCPCTWPLIIERWPILRRLQ